jgi:hypothetical protein
LKCHLSRRSKDFSTMNFYFPWFEPHLINMRTQTLVKLYNIAYEFWELSNLLWSICNCSNLFQLIPTCSNLFQLVPTCSNLFQLVPTCSNLSEKHWCLYIAYLKTP